jgi:hypothetical protein
LTLTGWLDWKKMPVAEMAGAIGVHRSSLYRAMSGAPVGLQLALRIERFTGGEVPVETWEVHSAGPVRRPTGVKAKARPRAAAKATEA